MIAKKKRASRNFVIKWTKSPNQDLKTIVVGQKVKEENGQKQTKE